MIIFHRIVYHNNFLLSRKIFIYSPHTKNLSPFFVFSPPFRGTILKNTTKKQKKETHMDKTNSYTTPDPRDVNLKISNPKTIKKTKKIRKYT